MSNATKQRQEILRGIESMSHKELKRHMKNVVEAMYPKEDPEAQWSPDTLDDISQVLDNMRNEKRNERKENKS